MDINQQQTIKEAANQWVLLLQRGLSNEDKQTLIAWINADKKHHKAVVNAAKHMQDKNIVAQLNGIFPLERASAKPSLFLSYIALAACIIFSSMTAYNLLINGNFSQQDNTQNSFFTQTYQTQLGEQATYTLPDGSELSLNTNSFVKVNYSAFQRQLTLVEGEAYFKVSKDKARPFTVSVANKAFTALGTAFNIRKENNLTMALTVTEGTVLLSEKAQLTDHLSFVGGNVLPLSEMPGIVVKTGQKAFIKNNVFKEKRQISSHQLQKDIAWQQGVLIFDGTPLTDALKEISRYSNTHFKIADNEISTIKISGYYKTGDINGLLQSLHDTFAISHKKESYKKIVLTKS